MRRFASMAWITHPLTSRPSWLQPSKSVAVALLVGLHIAGLATLYKTEYGWFGVTLALLAWVLFNALWIALLRRPPVAAALSLASIAVLIVLSQFKYSILQLTLT